jgi:hypothetical protein
MNYFYLKVNEYISNLNVGNDVDFLFVPNFEVIQFKIWKSYFLEKI